MRRLGSGPKKKRLSRQARLGQQGINLIEEIVLAMGSRWSPGGPNEVGIDGYIELFDPSTEEALGKTLGVQSKAVSEFDSEGKDSLTFRCEPRDVEYWTQGNLPVILVLSRPASKEAYWISVKDYFSISKKSGSTVRFSKSTDKFSPESFRDLLNLSKDPDLGLYLGPTPRREKLYTNLLRVITFPPRIYLAETDCRSIPQVRKKLSPGVGGDWIVHKKSLFGFEDFSKDEWATVCETGSTEPFDTSEWSESDDPDRLNSFVELLKRALRRQVGPKARYWSNEDCYAFEGTREIRISYGSVKRRSAVTVVSKYELTTRTRERIERFRHLAFHGRFRRFDGDWYLELTPTYRFTIDGIRLDRYHAEKLSGIKRIEGNRAVLSALLVWADYLSPKRELFSSKHHTIEFGALAEYELEVGINDSQWSARDPSPPPTRAVDGQEMFLPLL